MNTFRQLMRSLDASLTAISDTTDTSLDALRELNVHMERERDLVTFLMAQLQVLQNMTDSPSMAARCSAALDKARGHLNGSVVPMPPPPAPPAPVATFDYYEAMRRAAAGKHVTRAAWASKSRVTASPNCAVWFDAAGAMTMRRMLSKVDCEGLMSVPFAMRPEDVAATDWREVG
jgi:hypothetical protein